MDKSEFIELLSLNFNYFIIMLRISNYYECFGENEKKILLSGRTFKLKIF